MKNMTNSEMSILGHIYHKKDIIDSLARAGCTIAITAASDRYDIQEAMESLNFAQSEIFWNSLLPKSIGKDKPLAVIKV